MAVVKSTNGKFIPTPSFRRAFFEAEVTGMRVLRGGQLAVTLVVPFADRDQAWTLAGASGLMLTCDLRRKRVTDGYD